eukprot:scaffold126867_cov21-Tisochrysis_lutea.AAC.3
MMPGFDRLEAVWQQRFHHSHGKREWMLSQRPWALKTHLSSLHVFWLYHKGTLPGCRHYSLFIACKHTRSKNQNLNMTQGKQMYGHAPSASRRKGCRTLCVHSLDGTLA